MYIEQRSPRSGDQGQGREDVHVLTGSLHKVRRQRVCSSLLRVFYGRKLDTYYICVFRYADFLWYHERPEETAVHATVTATFVHFRNSHMLSVTAHPLTLSSRVEHLRRASELCGTDSALRVRCHHAQVVHRADQIASAIPVFRGGAEFERVLETLPAGSTNANTFQRIRERMSGAEEEGVPLLVRLGETGWFAVRDGLKFSRTVIGEWAHVKVCRNDSRVIIQCKVGVKMRSA